MAVSPPAIFLAALILVKALTLSGGLLSVAEGILITLSNTAPWLLAGTALSLAITYWRGLPENIRAISQGLRGDPQRKSPPGPGR